MLRYPENLDEVSDCYPFVLFTVWHKLKAVKAKERWLPEQEVSHLRGFHNLQQPVRGGAHAFLASLGYSNHSRDIHHHLYQTRPGTGLFI